MTPHPRGRIVVGVSASLPGLAALRYAVAEARRRGRTAVTAVRAWPDPDHGSKPPPSWAADLMRSCAAEIGTAIDEAFGPAPDGITFVVRTPRGRPGPALADLLTEDDLLVLGTRRRRWLGPGTARYCLRFAPCPVVVVPAPRITAGGRARDLDDELRRLVQEQ
ncbi:universal stress protein [Actinoplanes sp. NBRC 101535]|uniref:universal stress protein n=1 Tax=Actinoplanes sp. NBRC 101535 TaxID=3032196 RepID=UPI0024A05888|nr:universal stress protein [Actinoplanes sp. NBRC 101535]GLY04123.1 hypothetical protein Acsp01_45020 [Actinoplanes sp. NBRC 101535]